MLGFQHRILGVGNTSIHTIAYVHNLNRILLNKRITITGSLSPFYFRRIQLRKGIEFGAAVRINILWNICPRYLFIVSWHLVKYTLESLVLLLYVLPTIIFCFSWPLLFRLSHITTLPRYHHYCCWKPLLLSLNPAALERHKYFC